MAEDKDSLHPPMTVQEYREKVADQNAYFTEKIEEAKESRTKFI